MNRFFNQILFTAAIITTSCIGANVDYREHFAKANELFRINKFDEAIEYYNKTIEGLPTSFQAYFNRGLAYAGKGDNINAEQSYRKAIEINPDYGKAHMVLGDITKEQDKTEEAIMHYAKALQSEPDSFDAAHHKARAHADLRQYTDAIQLYKKARAMRPDDVQCKLDYANTLNMMNKTEEALALYKELEAQVPNTPSVIYNIAYTLKKLNRYDEAFPYYHRVLQMVPDHAECHFGMGVAYLTIEDFENGWKEYEWRWSKPNMNNRSYAQPRWDGSNLAGKTILLNAEQGLGDTLQFIRYAKLLKDQGAKVYFASQNPLIDILSLCPYLDKVFSLNAQIPPFDVYAPLMSLPYIMGTRVETIPAQIPYLYADQDLVDLWKEKLSVDREFKIGICWQGNPNYSTPFLRNTVAAKSISVAEFAPIARIPGVKLYSLQKTTGEDQLKNLPDGFVLHDFGPDFDVTHGRFMDTAAVMKNLDLVITVDTSIVHLSGGLGVPTWMLLPEPADWRWMTRQSDTPWYPEMRMFRQPKPDDWKSVIQTVAKELSSLLAQRSAATQKKSMGPVSQEINIPQSLESLILTIAHKETEAVRTEDPTRLTQLRAELEVLTQKFYQQVPSSYEVNSLLTRLYEINKKIWVARDIITHELPHDEAFVQAAQKVITLCSLRDMLLKELLSVAHSARV